MDFVTDPNNLQELKISPNFSDFDDSIDFSNHKISYLSRDLTDKSVLDIGCVQHNPENYRSKYWVHKAILKSSFKTVGIDLSQGGVAFLQERGYNIIHADAQNFSLDEKFDVIIAGDIIEHLEDFAGFFKSCLNHLKKGGEIRISTPNPWYWRNIVKSILHEEVNNNPEHTCWICPRTLRQLAARHKLYLTDIKSGSTYYKDRLAPLPRGIKHTSWHGTLRRID